MLNPFLNAELKITCRNVFPEYRQSNWEGGLLFLNWFLLWYHSSFPCPCSDQKSTAAHSVAFVPSTIYSYDVGFLCYFYCIYFHLPQLQLDAVMFFVKWHAEKWLISQNSLPWYLILYVNLCTHHIIYIACFWISVSLRREFPSHWDGKSQVWHCS